MNDKRLYLTLLFSICGALICGPIAAESQALEVHTAGDISYVSGGVGASEQEALAQVKSDYNLRLLFAVTGSGAFLAEIPVTLADGKGQVLLEAVAAGPYFYARVPPGDYRISAERAGQVETRSVTVPSAGAVSTDFRWAQK